MQKILDRFCCKYPHNPFKYLSNFVIARNCGNIRRIDKYSHYPVDDVDCRAILADRADSVNRCPACMAAASFRLIRFAFSISLHSFSLHSFLLQA
jgi:hypothetical protein